MRVRHRTQGLPGQAAPDPQLRLEQARLYVVTPDLPAERVLGIAAAAARGGADIIQLRHKTLPRGELLDLALRLRELINDALFIVNDHVGIAVLSGADGAHLGPDDLSIAALIKRASDPAVKEVILALSATVEGQSTAHYITDLLHDADVRVTRLAHGVPVGGELDYLDEGTLSAAIRQRTAF